MIKFHKLLVCIKDFLSPEMPRYKALQAVRCHIAFFQSAALSNKHQLNNGKILHQFGRKFRHTPFWLMLIQYVVIAHPQPLLPHPPFGHLLQRRREAEVIFWRGEKKNSATKIDNYSGVETLALCWVRLLWNQIEISICYNFDAMYQC